MTTPTDEFRMAKGDAHFLEGTALMVLCALVIVTVLIAWGIGGSGFKDSIHGDAALGVALIGFVVGAVLDYRSRGQEHRRATPQESAPMSKDNALFLEGTTLMGLSALVIIAVIVAWAIGGDAYRDSIYGNFALGMGCAGFLAGALLDYLARRDRQGK